MSQSLDPSSTRSRANTGNSLSPATYGTSNPSAAGSSVSNGSLLDLYARSPGSYQDTADAPLRAAAAPPAAPSSSIVRQAQDSFMPLASPTRGFQAQGRDLTALATGSSLPPSDSNASIWTTASASPTVSLPQSKRASMAGFDVDAMRSIQPAHDTHAPSATTPDAQLPTSSGVTAAQEDSDGSDYGDEEMPGAFSHDSYDRSADRTIQSPARRSSRAPEEVYSNALPSPPVPTRTSSVMRNGSSLSPSSSNADTFTRTDSPSVRHASSRSNSGQFAIDPVSQARRIIDPRLESNHSQVSRDAGQALPVLAPSPILPSPANNAASQGPISPRNKALLQTPGGSASLSPDPAKADTGSSHELSLAEQQRLESELLAEADESRPRTLKEARERARLRKQQSDATSSPPATANITAQPSAATTSPRKGASLHVRDVAASTAAASADEQGSRSSIESRDRPMRNPKRISNLDNTQTADHRSISERSAPSDYSHDSGIEGAFSYDDRAGPAGQLLDVDANADPQAGSMNDLTDAVDSAMNDLSFGDDTLSGEDEFATPLPPPPQQETRPQMPAALPSARSLASVTGAGVSSPLASPAKYAPPTPRTSSFPTEASKQSLAQTTVASPTHQRVMQPPVPPVPSHIDIYGKTVPMPKAFASKTINVDKRRLSSWERARSYAQYTNELLHLQTGLSLWMEVVQRPAMRQQNSRTTQAKQTDDWLTQGTLPRSRHIRDEGSYADSVRSDMTFPMRGDGAKAKEIVSVMPTMVESPVRTPVNLPYPGVVAQQQQPRSNSTQSFSSIVPPHAASSNDSLPTTTGTVSRSGGGNRFFSGLGRKNSKRAQPAAVTVPSLSSAAAAVRGSRAYLANNRASHAVSPGVAMSSRNSASSLTPTMDSFETSQSRPESPSAPKRLSGLGLGPESSGLGSSGRLDTVREVRNPPSTTPAAGLRAPLGPRAPGSRSPNDMARSASNQSPVTPNTQAGFGTGPTFVSRLGGGSFSGPANPIRPHDGYASPDYLAPRRTSDLSSTASSSNSASAHESPRVGLRSSMSYGSVRDKMRRGSHNSEAEDEGWKEALVKLGDILPDADERTLRYYLKKAKGNDLTAIGDYLHDQSLGKLPKF